MTNKEKKSRTMLAMARHASGWPPASAIAWWYISACRACAQMDGFVSGLKTNVEFLTLNVEALKIKLEWWYISACRACACG